MRTRVVAVALCATLPVAASNALADEGSAAAAGATVQTSEQSSESATYSYTWDELVELIPDIKKMHVVSERKNRRRVADSDEVAGTTKLCRRERAPNSMIKRRVCFTLDEYVEQYVRARQYYSEIMAGYMTRGFLGEGSGPTNTGRTSYP